MGPALIVFTLPQSSLKRKEGFVIPPPLAWQSLPPASLTPNPLSAARPRKPLNTVREFVHGVLLTSFLPARMVVWRALAAATIDRRQDSEYKHL